MSKIVLIDGNSILNRAFYGVPLLTNGDGTYTNAVYGFLNILFKQLDEEKPEYLVVAFDLPQPTFRHLKFDDYKGNRKSMPDELRPQLGLIKEVLSAMNINICQLEGYEADDILGSFAVKAEGLGLTPTIISGDRDLLQIASKTIKIKIPKTKGGKTEVEEYFENDVVEKYGVTPKEFIEVKALMGDASDNIPGVAGIGEKTAVKIIQEYKSVENAIENSEQIKPKKAAENLKQYRDLAILSKELATICLDVPLELNLENSKIMNMLNDDSYQYFKSLEFKSFLDKFESRENKITESNHFQIIKSVDEAKIYFEAILNQKEVAYKMLLEESYFYGISFSYESERGVLFLFESEILFQFVKTFFESDVKKITHDAKKDIVFLKHHHIDFKNLSFDTLIAYYILNSTKDTYDYSDIAKDFLDEMYISTEEFLGKGKSKARLHELDEKQLLFYCATQSDIFFRAKRLMEKQLIENKQEDLYYKMELPLIAVLADMEFNGIKIDNEELLNYQKDLEEKIEILTSEIYEIAGEEFNINSPKQLGVILFEKLALKGSKKTKTGYSTAAEVLEKLRGKHFIINKILDYRTYVKLKSTYADGLLNVMNKDTHKIYSTFNQAVTATGRISSTEPNLQNIPIKIELGRKLRKVFIPKSEEYIFLDGDYSQIELRVLAHISDDDALINAFKEGQDIHRLTASQVFKVPFDLVSQKQRSDAKAVNFGIVYGIGAFSLSQDLGITKKSADDYINGYFEKYPGVKRYMEETVSNAVDNGFVSTLFNRKRALPEINSKNFVERSFGERVAMNMPIQGSAADIMKIAMINVFERFLKENLDARILLQVHDELLVEVKKEEAEFAKKIVKEEMEKAVSLKVQLEVDVHEGNNWYESKM